MFQDLTIKLATLKGVRVERPGRNTLVIHWRHVPAWAMILGIVGLLFFVVGLIFFFVKSTDTVTVLGRDAEAGSRFTATGLTSPQAPMTLYGTFGYDRYGKPRPSQSIPASRRWKKTREVGSGSKAERPAKTSPQASLPETIAELASLRDRGILSDEEFQAAKTRLLR